VTAVAARIRVVVVDDAEPVRRLLCATLERDGGFEVVGQADNGLEGVRVVLAERPDLVVLDLAMPVMDGLEAIPKMLAGSPQTCIVVLSGFDAPQVESDVLGLGAAAYIPKGVSPLQLATTLKQLYGRANGDTPEAVLSPPETTLAGNPTAAPAPEEIRLQGADALAPLRSELGYANRELERRTDELARAKAELEQFASIASHDLAEPLRNVTGFVTLLLEDYGDRLEADAAEYVRYIAEGVTRMQALIDDLLTFSRVGARPMQMTSVACGEVVGAAVDALSARIEATGATVSIGDLPRVQGDFAQLVQLFENLLGNALTFVAPSTSPRVEVTAVPDPDGWHLTVTDNGVGIDPKDRDRVFRVFQRLHGRDAYEGTGLGLAICERIVQRHGGHISVDGAPQQGSTFHVLLPRMAGVTG